MFRYSKFAFVTALLLAVTWITGVSSNLHAEIDSGLCGGPLEADSGTLIFPRTDNTLCIWTIHLPTTTTVRLSFSHLDIAGGDDGSCAEGGIRLYSLTNLIPGDRLDGYSFCNSNPPPTTGSLFLPENLITVIYRSTNGSNGFTLNWEGVSIQPIPKIHESTFSTASSGVIRYPPIVGREYPQNFVSSWLVQSNIAEEQGRQELQMNLPYVDVEECSRGAPEDCLCDALILYQVTREGFLEEERRLCGNVTSLELQNLSPNFILALFTDDEDVPEEGKGFELIYDSTLKPPVSNTSFSCGGVVEGMSGLIEYKRDERLEIRERCLWTIRSPARTEIKLTFNKLGFESWGDSIEVLGIASSGKKTQFAFSKADQGSNITIDATVVVISLFTYYLDAGTGFSLSFESGGSIDNQVSSYRDFSYGESNMSTGGVISYPGNGDRLKRKELSTFVIQHEYSSTSPYEPFTLNVTKLNLNRNPETGNCTDMIRVFRLHSAPGNPTSLQEVQEYGKPYGLCQMDQVNNEPYFLQSDRVSVIFLVTDHDQQNQNLNSEEGFEVSWNVDINGNSMY